MELNKLGISELQEQLVISETEKRYADLLVFVNILLLKDPNNSDLLLYKLKAHEGLGTLNDHLSTIQKYINVKSTDATGFLLLHQVYLAQNYLAGAIIALLYALSIEPDNDECLQVLINLIQQVDPNYTQVKINIMTTDRVGHLACEVEPLLRKTQDEKHCLYLFLSAKHNVANQYLYSLIKSHSHVIEDSFLYNLYVSRPTLLDDYFFAEYPYDVNSTKRGIPAVEMSTKGYPNLVNIYHNFPPVFKIPKADGALAWQLLSIHGITPDDKIVCLHVRDSHYLAQKFPNNDFTYHDYRDADINTYQAAVEHLTEQGYKVIRIGSNTNQVLAQAPENYFDFCVDRDIKHGDFLEVFLLSVCDFFIGTSSGPHSIASIFNKPILSVNVAPIHPVYSRYGRFLPKQLLCNGKKVNLLDVCNGKTLSSENEKQLLFSMSGAELVKYGYEYVSNSQEDILGAVKEFCSQMEEKIFNAKISQAQIEYLENLSDNFAYKKSDCFVVDSFLKNYPDLF
ncbi:TIGR04372 family glycosyltransferase [Thalassotalea agariperforans]